MFGKLFKRKNQIAKESGLLGEGSLYSRPVSYYEFSELRDQFRALCTYVGVDVFKPYGYTVKEIRRSFINQDGGMGAQSASTGTMR